MATIQLKPRATKILDPWLIEGIAVEGFGSVEKGAPDKLLSGYTLTLGDRPYVRSVRKLYKHRGQALPPEIAALKGETYILAHAVGLVAKSGPNKIDRISYQASFSDAGSTIELFPNTRFKEYFTASTKFEAGVSADGYAKLPDQVGKLAKEIINIGAGAELQVGAEASIVGKLTLTLKTPKVQAVGNSSSAVHWQFDRDEDPLVGDHVMVQTVVVPKGQEKLTLRMRASASIDPGVFRRPVQITTDELTADVELE